MGGVVYQARRETREPANVAGSFLRALLTAGTFRQRPITRDVPDMAPAPISTNLSQVDMRGWPRAWKPAFTRTVTRILESPSDRPLRPDARG